MVSMTSINDDQLVHNTPDPTSTHQSTTSSQTGSTPGKLTDSNPNDSANLTGGDGNDQDEAHGEDTQSAGLGLGPLAPFNQLPLQEKLQDHYNNVQVQMDSLFSQMKQCVGEIEEIVRTLMEQRFSEMAEQFTQGINDINKMEANQAAQLARIASAVPGPVHTSHPDVTPLTLLPILAATADKVRDQMLKFVQAISKSYAQIFQNPLDP
ncbi:hypothetical protein BC936DRAFT_147179 [Jimgerdemannia flammicorona]|uniref:Uncharacterized protein n=1 Tax=Jimgerdemannia flammicorona TaxID=994334 RepID=A0A433D5W1_9FUNG|nr:hypothetical protein BC936DRAFT_147179 [Jimgerdemannia flammicorona]